MYINRKLPNGDIYIHLIVKKRVVCRVKLILSYIIRSIYIEWHIDSLMIYNYLQFFFSPPFFPRHILTYGRNYLRAVASLL